MKKHIPLIAAFCIFTALNTNAFAEGRQYEIDYIKGNLTQKTQCLLQAAQFEDYKLIMSALDFSLEVQPLLGNDTELNVFVETAVHCLKNDAALNDEEVAQKLGSVFKTFQSEKIKIATLDKLKDFPSVSNTVLVNAYVNEKIQSGLPMDNVLLKAIQTLKYIGNSNSFNMLFIADVLDIWPGYNEQLEDSFDPLIQSCEKEILQIQSAATNQQKIRILEILSRDKNVSAKIRGEVAENMLSVAIKEAGNSKDVSKEQIDIQLKAMEILSSTQWTRGTALVTNYFSTAQKEYENQLLDDYQFSTVIGQVATFASNGTVAALSSYLDTLNKSMEQGSAPVNSVVLSVINALGGLGDKSAFDCLLYVTYLDYPDEIVIAARNALSKLRW